VHRRFFGSQRDGIRHLESDPERAAREIAIFEEPDLAGMTLASRTERELRRRASFTEAECEQVDAGDTTPRSTSEPAPPMEGAAVRPHAGSVRDASADLCDLQRSC
jgi:hypothetical protein